MPFYRIFIFMYGIFQQIQILFFGLEWEQADLYRFEGNAIHNDLFANPNFVTTQGESQYLNRIVGFQISRKAAFREKLPSLLKGIPLGTTKAVFFIVNTRKDASCVMKLLENNGWGEIRLYGIDPDYFSSLVPLSGDAHKIIEQYILGLKTDFSFVGKIKHGIKTILIHLSCSGKLYESFVIMVSPSRAAKQ